MTKEFFAISLAACLLFWGTVAAAGFRDGEKNKKRPVWNDIEQHMQKQQGVNPGDVITARLLRAANRLNVHVGGRSLEEIAVDVEKAIKVKKSEALKKYDISIRAFSGSLVRSGL